MKKKVKKALWTVLFALVGCRGFQTKFSISVTVPIHTELTQGKEPMMVKTEYSIDNPKILPLLPLSPQRR